MKRNREKKLSLKWNLLGSMLLCWVLPLTVIVCGMLYLVSSMVSRQIEKTIHVSTEKAVEICELQLEGLVTASKNASYQTTVKDSYMEYLKQPDSARLYNTVTGFLNWQYKYNGSLLCTMIFFLEEPQNVYYTYNTYQDNNTGNAGYARVRYFQEHLMEDVIRQSESLDTNVQLVLYKKRLYLIRNLMESLFSAYGMIVEELEPGAVFDSLNSVWGITDYEIYIDGEPLFGNGVGAGFEPELLVTPTGESVFLQQKDSAYSYKVIESYGQKIAFLLKLDTRTIIDDLFLLRYVFVFVLLLLIPLTVMVFRFFQRQVTNPVDELVHAAGEITAGNYGRQIEAKAGSREFSSLYQMFNEMSHALKYQFERIYSEELALRDANIKALQSQINPHFLNNTLEIINWEARMNGNDKVSGMIEALATMLNATMNREQKQFVTLAEEMTYVDAYLYIIKSRFGDRIEVVRKMEDGLSELPVPLLIIQPIVENAVEHGMNGTKQGRVELNIFRLEDKLYIEIKNTAKLSEEDRKKIELLLSERELGEKEKHISLGIRNVNRRLKIIYGDDCGLTIKSDKENSTVSTIIVKIDKVNKKSQ